MILHLDRDIWDEYIQSFVSIYHEIEKVIINNFIKCKQIQMANRNCTRINIERILW